MSEQIAFSEIERLSKIALESGDLNKLQGLLTPLLSDDDKKRSAAENLFLYRTLGTMHKERDENLESLEFFVKAHNHDPRDLESLQALVDAELEKAPKDADSKLLMDLLIFHRHELKSAMVMRIFKHIGDAYLAGEELDKARECYEKALDVRPGEMTIINALLSASEASGDADAIRKSREKLLSSMTSAESRAAVLVSIGDDLLNKKNDEAGAKAMYEEALAECAQSTAAHQRLLVISEHAEDWESCLNTLTALVRNCSDDDEKCKYLLKQAWIFKEKLNNPKHAIQLFNDVLDIKPDQVEIFKQIIEMLQKQENYKGIEENYEKMIARQEKISPLNVKFMASLCKLLGDLRRQQLNDIKGATKAYKTVSDFYPDNVGIHQLLASLYAQFDDTLEDAVHENREVLRLAPDKLDSVADLARCYRRLEKFDESLCIYRVLDVLGINDEEGKAIVAKFADTPVPKISDQLSGEQWAKIFPKTLDRTLLRIFKVCMPIISERFVNTLDKYGIKEKEARIDVSEDTIFVRALRNSSKALGFAEIPNLYRFDKLRGISNAYLENRALLVNSNLLKDRSEKEIAFSAAKQLILLRPEFYLLQLGMRVVDGLLQIIFKTVEPSLNIELKDATYLEVSKYLDKNLKANDRDNVKKWIHEILERNTKLNISLFMESVEDFANRVGLLFCDDPAVINRMLSDEGHPVSTRAAKARVGSLLLWSLSEDYTMLRKELGIAISA